MTFVVVPTQVLGKMVVDADERRHGVGYMSEAISYRQLYRDCVDLFEQGQADRTIDVLSKVPSQHWFELQFWPSNEHVRAAFCYTGRFPLKLQMQIRNLRKHHAHAYYCSKQRKLAKAWAYLFRDELLAIGGDDKATGNIGEPGTACSVLAKQRKKAAAIHGNEMVAMDHEAGHVRVKVVPTVLLKHDPPTAEECSWYSGVASVILKNSVFEGSSAFGALLEMLLTYKEELLEKSGFMLHTDGGGEHNLSFPSVQAAIAAFCLKCFPDHAVFGNSAPYHSFQNEPERVMSILNLALYGVALERPRIDSDKFPGEEARFHTTKTIADLRTQAARFPTLAAGVHDALNPVFECLYQRFEKLRLHDVPFQRGEHASSSDVDGMFECVRDLLAPDASGISRTEFKRKHLDADCQLQTILDNAFFG